MNVNNIADMFNREMDGLLSNLVVLIPDDSAFNVTKLALKGALLGNPKEPIRKFIQHLTSEYKASILNKDQDFFMNHDYDVIRGGDADVTDELITKLKTYWTARLNDENRNMVWGFLSNMVKLSDKYVELSKNRC